MAKNSAWSVMLFRSFYKTFTNTPHYLIGTKNHKTATRSLYFSIGTKNSRNAETFFIRIQKSLPGVSRKGLVVPYEACRRKQKTPHDNKTDLSVSFFIRCLGSLIGTDARYSQPYGWRATQCCSAYALQSVLFGCGGIIARPFVFCNRVSEQIFVSGVSCRYLPTSQLFLCRYTPFALF